nr:alpha/beta fold hydrolase [Actinacidiphila alni]
MSQPHRAGAGIPRRPGAWRIWEPVFPALAENMTVIAPDLPGLGASAAPSAGYTAGAVAADVLGVLDALEIERADMVGIDLGTPVAFMAGIARPDRIRRLVLMEGLVGDLPGVEEFLRGGPPWWFGFHAVPGLGERVLHGHEPEYLDFFLRGGTLGDGVTGPFRAAVHEAYRGREALSAAFAYYRAFPDSARQIAKAAGRARWVTPTLTIGGATVGEATHRQIQPIADDVRAW